MTWSGPTQQTSLASHGVAQQLLLAAQKNGVPSSQQWPMASHSRVTSATESKPQHSDSTGPSQQIE
jgi:hypothetical protein